MNDFSFGKISTSSKKKTLALRVIDNPLLLDEELPENENPLPVVLLVDRYYNEDELDTIKNFMYMNGVTYLRIVASINVEFNQKICDDIGVIKYYKQNKSDFYKHLPKFSPIITSGSALYSLLQEDDIYPSHVHQCIFGKTDFLFSIDLTRDNCHRVFPIDSLSDIFVNGFNKSAVDSFITKLAKVQIKKCSTRGFSSIPRFPKLNKIFIHDENEFNELFYEPNKDRVNEVVAWDLETSGLDFFTDRIGCITLSFDGVTGYYIPWKVMTGELKSKLGYILKNNKQLGANLKFDIKHLWKNGVPEAHIDEDILQLGHTLDETRSNSLKSLAFYYSEFGGYERPLDDYKDKMGKDICYLDIPEDILWDYAVMDAIVTKRVWNNMMKHVNDLDKQYPNEFAELEGFPHYNDGNGMLHYYYTYRIPACNTYALMEYNGVYMSKEKLDKVRKDMIDKIAEYKDKLCKSFNVDEDFPWESSKELGILLEKKKWEDFGRTKSGEFATGDFQLSRWSKNHSEAKDIIQLRSLNTLLNTFVGDDEGTKGWPQYFRYHEEDGSYRMHPSFMSMMADSGRSRCGSPNLQQVPTRGMFTKEMKSCFSSPNEDEYYVVTVDYSSLQLRLASIDIRTNDYIIEAFKEKGVDMHSTTAWNTFFQNKELDVDIIKVEQNGRTYEFLGGEVVLTENRGEVLASELTEEDTIKEL